MSRIPLTIRVPEEIRGSYIRDVWAYMHSRYPSDMLTPDLQLKNEIKGIADLMAQVNRHGQCITWDEIDMVRYAQDFLEFRGTGCLYKIFLLLYDRKTWDAYKKGAKGEQRRQMLTIEERKVNDFLEKEKKRNVK